MTLNSILLILKRRFTAKWGRFLLASGGIVIGVWAISLTTSLSLGLSETIIQAINSQPFTKEIQLSKSAGGETSYFEISGPPIFEIVPLTEVQYLARQDSRIATILPDAFLNVYLNLDGAEQSCVEAYQSLENRQPNLERPEGAELENSEILELSQAAQITAEKCPQVTIILNSFDRFYESYRANWIGQTEEIADDEIVVCFECDINLKEKFGVSSPEELIGKKISFEYQRAPDFYETGKDVNVVDFDSPDAGFKESIKREVTIAAVVDDRGLNTLGLNAIYLPNKFAYEAANLQFPDFSQDRYGPLNYIVYINSYTDLSSVVTSLEDKGYLVLSVGQLLVNSISTGFLVLTIFLAGFGLIALIASIFGIISVMTISVLERKKEIGILKSLGAKDSDIFKIFVFESILIGLLGWLIGISLALISGFGISQVFTNIILTDPNFEEGLKNLNITDFNPTFPWWLVLGTWFLAVLFTSISGAFPAIKASKENPVEVLRSE